MDINPSGNVIDTNDEQNRNAAPWIDVSVAGKDTEASDEQPEYLQIPLYQPLVC